MFHVGIDMGGTFTDFVVTSPQGTKTLKLPTNTANPLQMLLLGLEELAAGFNLPLEDFLSQTDKFAHGTTAAINALLQGKGAKTALLTTEGFRDALEIRRSQLPNQWDLRFSLPPVLVPRYLRFGVRERIDYKGDVLVPLDEAHLAGIVEQLKMEQVTSIACCLLFSFKNPVHERKIKKYLEEHLPGVYITISSDVASKIKDYERTSTTVLNAYLGPLLSGYLAQLEQCLEEKGLKKKLYLMQNNGGLSDTVSTKKSSVKVLTSGPAGGALGGTALSHNLNLPNLVLADMGGTSFDVSLVIEGKNQITPESEIEGYPVLLPMIQIKSIGAGGGSIAWVDTAGTLKVGPGSAGAVPGPACYSRGGEEPTVTDAALALGMLNPDNFLGGNLKLDREKARNVIKERIALPLELSVENAALAIYQIAASLMIDAVHLMTVQNGLDPRDFALLAAGGASPLFAGAMARELGIETVLIPAHSSVFCAEGMLRAGVKHDAVKSYLVRMDNLCLESLLKDINHIKKEVGRELSRQGIPEEKQDFEVFLEMKYSGQHHEIIVPLEESGEISRDKINQDFHLTHERLFGYYQQEKPWEIVNIRVTGKELRGEDFTAPPIKILVDAKHKSKYISKRPVYWDQDLGWQIISVLPGNNLAPGESFFGPGIIETPYTTIFIPCGSIAHYDSERNLIIKHKGGNHCDQQP
ncbi:MAG: hydantoinase/oxoprolinase family protein [Dehalobacterium sp.]